MSVNTIKQNKSIMKIDPKGGFNIGDKDNVRPQILNANNLKLAIDSESVNIYIDNGEDKEPTHVVYWHEDEWLEDAEFVVPAILRAIDLFVNNPKKLLEILN